jgi:hypothetical protein
MKIDLEGEVEEVDSRGFLLNSKGIGLSVLLVRHSEIACRDYYSHFGVRVEN